MSRRPVDPSLVTASSRYHVTGIREPRKSMDLTPFIKSFTIGLNNVSASMITLTAQLADWNADPNVQAIAELLNPTQEVFVVV